MGSILRTSTARLRRRPRRTARGPAAPSRLLHALTIEPLEARTLLSAPYPLAQTFALHSNPTALRRIYLDFDGHTTTGTQWNYSTDRPVIVTPVYSFEGDDSFSDAELTRIQRVWQRVSEDFAPFQVDVTTQYPGLEALRKRPTGGDQEWGIRVSVGGDGMWYSMWRGTSALYGGTAYVNSFPWASDTPAFVFASNLAAIDGTAGDEKKVADAASHEVGHSLGLNHDGTTAGVEYYDGHGSGQTSWGPLMGKSYARNLSQWSRGEYAGASNLQDDLADITRDVNGTPYRADDHGSTLASAADVSPAGGGPQTINVAGIIERNTDADVFSFVAGGALKIHVDPFERGPNLDVLAELYNASGQLLATGNPVSLLSADIDLTVSPGRYYLRIAGTGTGDPATNGYSKYGSLGRYTVSVQGNLGESPVTLTGTAGDDAITLRRAPDGGLNVWLNAPTSGSPTYVYPAGTFGRITIDAGDGDDRVTLDHAAGDPASTHGIAFLGGSGSDELTILGSGAADSIEAHVDQVLVNALAVSVNSVEQYVFDTGGDGDVVTLAAGLPRTPKLRLGGNPGDLLRIDAGTFRFDEDLGPIAVRVAPGQTARFNASQNLGSLRLDGDSAAEVTPGGVKELHLDDLVLSDEAVLDLADNDLVLHAANYGAFEALLSLAQSRVASARNASQGLLPGGLWTGPGITSRNARADESETTGLAVAGHAGLVVVKYTWNGDATADGAVDSDDYHRIDRGFLTRKTLYADGDFDLNGLVSVDDYALIDAVYLQQTQVL